MWRLLLQEYLERPIRPVVWPVIRRWKKWKARRPNTFSEKVRYKMYSDRRPLAQTFADKAAVREYVRATVGSEILSETYALVSDPAELEPTKLPRNFVIKPTHGCGGLILVWDQAEPTGELPPVVKWQRLVVHPEHLDWPYLRKVARFWLSLRYGGIREWCYQHIPPRLLVEELLRDATGEIPADYKFYVFHGRCRYVLVVRGRGKAETKDMYTADWTPVSVTFDRPRATHEIPPPPTLVRMREIAEALGRDTDFVRVDLYDLGDRIVFGELTNHPNAGRVNFSPRSFDAELGRWWQVPETYR